ncbi:MAG: OmpA family protein [Rhodospirillaceae bacterium]|nr:OmpA family protein [Rhodospirillaceae bacterium]
MKLKFALLASIALMAAPAMAAEPAGPYLSLGGGLSLPESSGIDVTTAGTTPGVVPVDRAKATFDNGYILSGAAGYRFESGLRTEVEVNYRRNTLDDIDGFPAVGRQGILGVTGNLIYDINLSDAPMGITPYIGAGVGPSWNKWSGVTTAGSPTFTDKDFAWQWQLMGGISVPVSEQMVVFTEYKYIGTIGNEFNSVPAGFKAFHHSARSHNLLVGLRFNFGSPAVVEQKAAAVAPPPPPPPPPAPPPPPPVPQKFLVFFDFDRANLRADASKIVSEAADYAKKNGKARITATGHADTSGSPAYNLALSERRAKAVKSALTQMGFKDNEVVIMFKGESEPLVATGDGVKEPQNRRVEIIME